MLLIKLCIILPKASGYVKRYNESTCMYFLIEDAELLEKYNNKVWDKVGNSIKIELDSKLMCYEKYLKTEIKPYTGKINKDFHDDRKKRFSLHLLINNLN